MLGGRAGGGRWPSGTGPDELDALDAPDASDGASFVGSVEAWGGASGGADDAAVGAPASIASAIGAATPASLGSLRGGRSLLTGRVGFDAGGFGRLGAVQF